MTRRSTSRLAVIAAMALSLAVATTASALVPGSTGPRAWSRQLCRSIDHWQVAIGRASTKADRAVVSPADPDGTRDAIKKLLRTATRETTRLVRKLGKAGAPSVADGKDVQETVLGSLRDVRDALADARDTVAEASSTDAAQLAGTIDAALITLETSLDDVAVALEDASVLGAAALTRALRHAPACQALTGS